MTPTEKLAVAALAAQHGTRALAMWNALQRFCEHHNRDRFEAEKQAIRDCVLIDFQEYSEKRA